MLLLASRIYSEFGWVCLSGFYYCKSSVLSGSSREPLKAADSKIAKESEIATDTEIARDIEIATGTEIATDSEPSYYSLFIGKLRPWDPRRRT